MNNQLNDSLSKAKVESIQLSFPVWYSGTEAANKTSKGANDGNFFTLWKYYHLSHLRTAWLVFHWSNADES